MLKNTRYKCVQVCFICQLLKAFSVLSPNLISLIPSLRNTDGNDHRVFTWEKVSTPQGLVWGTDMAVACELQTYFRSSLPSLRDFSEGEYWLIEWFSFECRKTKTKVITLANHIGHRQYIEPIKTRSNYMWLTQSAGKCMRARHNWLWFYFWLDEKVARIF